MNNWKQSLILAAENGQMERVKTALKNGASPNAMGPNSSALHCATFNGHLDIVKLLLKHGANPNIQDNQSFYPLHLAASKGHLAICNTLIKAGADLEAVTSSKGTALHVAAVSNYTKVVSALIKAGANLEAKDQHKETPFFSAVWMGRNKVIKCLIKAGTDIHARNFEGDTALHAGLRRLFNCRLDNWSSEGINGSFKVQYNIQKGAFRYNPNYNPDDKKELGYIMTLKDQRYCAAKPWGPAKHIDYLDAFDTVKTLIKSGIDLHSKGKKEQTPICVACHTGEAKIIQALIKEGANFDGKSDFGANALHYVAGSGRLDGLQIFFKLNDSYDINAVDDFGWTAAHYLADVGGHPTMAEILLSKGIDTSIKSTEIRGPGIPKGSTAQQVALHWKDSEMADILKTKSKI